ncbi:MAG: sulfotransferase [Alphaproteobacteria bacterium]|nr:sulfotransferase [Alphaproteobacteria bacterium]MCB9693582.1 sulfotransferase [Alphaproteobacteria bacterium]
MSTAVADLPVPSRSTQHVLASHLGRLERDPTDLASWKGAVESMLELGAFQDAVRAQEQIVALCPTDPDAWSELGRIHIVKGSRERPIECFQEALKLDPMHHRSRVRLGMLLLHHADLETAGDCFAQVLRMDPENMEARAGAAQVLDRKGDAATAWKLIESTRGRPSTLFAIAAATVGLHARQPKAALRIVKKALSRAQGHDRSMLYYAEGDLHDALNHPSQAWRAWESANKARRLTFDGRAHDRVIQALIHVTRHVPAPTGPTDERPVFVVGMPRSGTTLLETMIDAHPLAQGVGELHALRDIVAEVPRIFGSGNSWLEHVERIPEVAFELGQAYLDEIGRLAPGAQRVVDKMPNNALHLAVASMCLPGARFIWSERDEDDVAVSCFQKSLGAGLAWTNDLADIRCWQRNLRLLKAHWEAVLPNPMLTVHYEDVVADPEGQARRIAEFLGIPYDPAMLRFHENRRQVATASFDQVTEKIHSRRVGRAEKYRAFLHPGA